MKTAYKHIHILFFTLLSLIIFRISGCKKEATELPWMEFPGYNSELILNEEFDIDSGNWVIEGNGSATISTDGRLDIQLAAESTGIMLWMHSDFSDNFQLEYKIAFPDTPGTHILFINAKGTQGEDILEELPSRQGFYEEYTQNMMANYQISMHCWDSDGQHIGTSRIRKNPGNLLLSRSEVDPCFQNREYLIDVIKISNRILFYVDGNLIHDLKDKGGFGPIYKDGKFGFWFQGRGGNFHTLLDIVRVFKLKPR